MFSATMPQEIKKLASKILTDPFEISHSVSKPPDGVLQAAYLTHDAQKIPLINRLIAEKPQLKSILIFCSTKKKVSDISRALRSKSYKVESISSDLEQKQREEVLMRFKSKDTRVLVATDVLSRGIDIKDIDLVINYDAPQDAEDYVHRVGRTARAAATGIALTLVNQADMATFHKIEKLIDQVVIKLPVPPELGESPKWELKPRHKPANKRHQGNFSRKRK